MPFSGPFICQFIVDIQFVPNQSCLVTLLSLTDNPWYQLLTTFNHRSSDMVISFEYPLKAVQRSTRLSADFIIVLCSDNAPPGQVPILWARSVLSS